MESRFIELLQVFCLCHFQRLSAMIFLLDPGAKVHSSGALCSSHWNNANNGSATMRVFLNWAQETHSGVPVSAKPVVGQEQPEQGPSTTSSYTSLWTAWAPGLEPKTATCNKLSKTPTDTPASSDAFGIVPLLSGFQVRRLGHRGLPKPAFSRSDLMFTLT